MDENYLKQLINKYISGTATEQERNELLAWYRGNEEELVVPYENAEEEEYAKQQMLYILLQQVAPPQVKTINKYLYLKIAAAAVLLIGTCLFVYRLSPVKQPQTAAVIINTITTQRGERKLIHLVDGSVIYLSAGSSVKIPSAFNGPTREIAFEGEAFFEIAKDKKHPFIVHTGKTSTQVLGTTFNITDRENQPEMTVALITGKVAFTAGTAKAMLLPGHLVAYSKRNGTVRVKNITDVEAVLGRRNGNYEYHNIKVGAIAEDLNMNYGANITVQGGVKNCDFFGRIKQGESVGSFLQKLAIIENAKIIRTSNGYLIKGGGCE